MMQSTPTRDLLAAIVESSDAGIVSKTLDGIITSWNRAAERIFGYTAEEAIGRPARMLFPPDRVAEEQVLLAEVGAGRSVEHYQSERLRKDGSRVPVSVTLFPVRGSDGQVVGAAKIVRDITEDIRYERRQQFLAGLDDRLRAFPDPALLFPQAIGLLGEYLGVEGVSCEVVNDLLRVAHAGAADPDDASRAVCDDIPETCLASLRAGANVALEDVRSDPRLDARLRAQLQRSGIGAALWVPVVRAGRLVAVVVARAGSRRPWRREEIDLIQQVAGRAWDAAEQVRTDRERLRLLHEAEAANRAKDEFIAMLGHELRNPLSPIVTALQLIKMRGSGDWEREGVVIERQVRHLVRLVDDLLDVSRIVRGRVELKRECLEIADVVVRAVEVAGPLLRERDQRLVVNAPRNGLAVDADPERLAQVVSNLLTNAAKYTPRGGCVSVSAERRGAEVVLSVSDTGIGIPADMLPHVFELFVQGRQASDRAAGGLGLGLAIVRNLVERHGGRVEAQSDGPGLGSQFTVVLPHADQAAPRATGPSAPQSVVAAIGDLALPGILIVDDNRDGADMLFEVLSRQGYRTAVAYDALEALRVAADFKPEVALLDLGLPVIDGFELADRLRLVPGLTDLTLIALTGYGQSSDRARTREVGFHHHLVKPIDLEELERLVSAITRASAIRAVS